MAIREVLLFGNPFLRQKAESVDFRKDDVAGIVADMSDTLEYLQQTKQTGRAIAAVQIGIPKRIVYMNSGGRRIVMVNPVITERSSGTFTVWDSCLSCDIAFFGRVGRAQSITVAWNDEEGNCQKEVFFDSLSELFQHEIEHLDGILFTDKLICPDVMMKSEYERQLIGINPPTMV